VAKAELPPLTNGYPTFTLPHTFQMSPAGQDIGYIDVDNFGSPDFYVEFFASGSSSYCIIRDINNSYSGSQILTEFYSSAPNSPGSVVTGKAPLSIPGIPLTSILEKNELIGPISYGSSGSLAGFGGPDWYYNAFIFQNPIALFDAPLMANYSNGLLDGYLGTYYSGSGGWYYGWLNVEIAPDGQWVKINSAGHAATPGTPVPAGLNDPFAVPIPLIASILGFGLIGGGVFLRKRKMKVA
jgi:hypothetical protein